MCRYSMCEMIVRGPNLTPEKKGDFRARGESSLRGHRTDDGGRKPFLDRLELVIQSGMSEYCTISWVRHSGLTFLPLVVIF